jgi:hypothetical protein
MFERAASMLSAEKKLPPFVVVPWTVGTMRPDLIQFRRV